MGWRGQWKDGIPPGALPASHGAGHACPRCKDRLVRLTYGYHGDYLVEWGCPGCRRVGGWGQGGSLSAASRKALASLRLTCARRKDRMRA